MITEVKVAKYFSVSIDLTPDMRLHKHYLPVFGAAPNVDIMHFMLTVPPNNTLFVCDWIDMLNTGPVEKNNTRLFKSTLSVIKDIINNKEHFEMFFRILYNYDEKK